MVARNNRFEPYSKRSGFSNKGNPSHQHKSRDKHDKHKGNRQTNKDKGVMKDMNEEYHKATETLNKGWGNFANSASNVFDKGSAAAKAGFNDITDGIGNGINGAISGIESTLLIAGIGIAFLLYYSGKEVVHYAPKAFDYAKENLPAVAKSAAEVAPLLLV